MTAAIFESALKAYPRFAHQGRPVLAWLYTIAGRRVADFYRRRRPMALLDESQVDSGAGPADQAEQHWELRALHEALERVSAGDRQLVDLHYFAELGHRDVAAMLGITANAATVRLHRALKRLAREMEVVHHG